MDVSKRLKGKMFSARSQASYQREAALRKQLREVKEIISRCQRVSDNEKVRIDQLSQNTRDGEHWAANLIPKSSTKIKEMEGQIGVFEPQREKIQAQIDALVKPSPAEEKERAKNQRALAESALERLECERKLSDVIRTAKSLLEKRAEMTGRIWELAGKIELQLSGDSIAEDVMGALQRILNCDLEGQSEKWVDWLFGDNQRTEPYIVRDDRIFFAETLVSANAYQRGDQVQLTAEQVAEIRSTEQTTRGNLIEVQQGGGVHSGQGYQLRHARVEKVAEAGQQGL